MGFFLASVKSLEMTIYRTFTKLHEYRARRSLSHQVNSNEKIDKLQLLKMLPKNPTIVEVGCHVGIDTLEFSLLFPEGKVYGFEPHPQLFAECWQRTQLRTNVQIWQTAMSDELGGSIFHPSSGSSTGSGSLLEPTVHKINHPEVTFHTDKRFFVFTNTLDLWSRSMSVEKIDLLWIDVQGAELLVFKGAKEMLQKTEYIYVEVSEVPLYEGGAAYSELKVLLEDLGFNLKQEYIPNASIREGNALFHKELVEK
jgi:2-O-methyltransferase